MPSLRIPGVWALAACVSVNLATLPEVSAANEPGNNDEATDRSYFYKEVDKEDLEKMIKKSDKDIVCILYGTTCSHCQELHPQQEKAAKKILEETNEVAFARLDTFRFRYLGSHLHKTLPDWTGANVMSEAEKEGSAAPRMWIFRVKEKHMEQIPHEVMGWDKKVGWKKVREWVRANINNGEGYDWKAAKKGKGGGKADEL